MNKMEKLFLTYSWKSKQLKKIDKFFKKEILKLNKNIFLKKYIKFAIDNWYKIRGNIIDRWWIDGDYFICYYISNMEDDFSQRICARFNIYKMINSKEFIEAINRWIYWK